MISVVAINRAERLALLSDDTTVPITNLFDSDCDETDDLEEARAFVAGAGGCWFTCAFDDFESKPEARQ